MAEGTANYMIYVDMDTYQKVEEYRFKSHIYDKSEATEKLIKLGLQAVNDHAESASRRS